MRILALDPGAKRCGWSVLSEGEVAGQIKYYRSGILGLEPKGNYQDFRLRLIEYWVQEGVRLLDGWEPDVLVSEVVPPTGGSIPSIINRQLALTAVTTVQTLAAEWGGALIEQIGATTVKKSVAGSGKASKVRVRDGVLRALPELEARRPEWTGKDAVYDEVDALAVGIAYLKEKSSPT